MLKISSYPFYFGIVFVFIVSSILLWLNLKNFFFFFGSFFFFFFVSFMWCKDFFFESLMGLHNNMIRDSLKFSFLFFIFSEIMFFFGFFWSYFDSCFCVSLSSGFFWPPYFIFSIGPFGVSLLNTFLLLMSSFFLSYSNFKFFNNDFYFFYTSYFLTLFFGFMFLFFQFKEYTGAFFSMSDGIYGSVFYGLTGLHMSHVILGVFCLFSLCFHFFYNFFNLLDSLWFEMSSFYWHFVDFVWLLVWSFLYVWGS